MLWIIKIPTHGDVNVSQVGTYLVMLSQNLFMTSAPPTMALHLGGILPNNESLQK